MTEPNSVTLVLGIPIDGLTPEQAVRRTLELADAYREDARPRQIVTVNVDFLTNALSWTPWSVPRHPELLEVLRRADLVTADGMPVVWLARLLGTSIRGRVTGADLVPALAAAMAKSGHRLYLLGGRGDIARQAADRLVVANPGLRIAGIDSPFVHTDGAAMLESEQDDADTVARINAASPDVLLIAFGNPKQEIWFHRNRHRLRAGVSIGIGGTFEFIVGRVSRAPTWMQRIGLEWVYRISQDPGRLWKRYSIGLAKLAVMSIPLVLHYRYQRWRFSAAPMPNPAVAVPASAMRHLVLPAVADADWARAQQSSTRWEEVDDLVVDFSAARFLDSSALGYLVRVWKSRQNGHRPVRAAGLRQTQVAGLLKMTRTWDIFAEVAPVASVPDAASPGAMAGGLLDVEPLAPGVVVARLAGRLDADRAARLDLNALCAELGDRDVVLDLADLEFVDSIGLGLLFRLQRDLTGLGGRLVLCAARPPVRQLLEITRLTALFQQAQTREQALDLLAVARKDAA